MHLNITIYIYTVKLHDGNYFGRKVQFRMNFFRTKNKTFLLVHVIKKIEVIPNFVIFEGNLPSHEICFSKFHSALVL